MHWDHFIDIFLFTVQLNALGNDVGVAGPLLAAGVGVTDVKRLWHRLQVQDYVLCDVYVTLPWPDNVCCVFLLHRQLPPSCVLALLSLAPGCLTAGSHLLR